MSLSEQLKGWEKYKAGGFTESFYKSNKIGTVVAYVRSLPSPGEWYVEIKNFETGETHCTPQGHEECFKSLEGALFYGDRWIHEYERL